VKRGALGAGAWNDEIRMPFDQTAQAVFCIVSKIVGTKLESSGRMGQSAEVKLFFAAMPY
jgi:hypothetical protein